MRSIAGTLVFILLLGAGAGITGAAQPTDQATIRNRAVAWLTAQVTPDGALISPYTSNPDLGMTAQGALALAGAGADPATVDTMIDYLQAHAESFIAPGGADDNPGSLAWLILDAVATGNDPRDFGGIDLVTRLGTTQRGGSTADSGLFGAADPTYDGAFRQSLALIALEAVGIENPAGLDWLTDQQCADGGFVAYRADTAVPCPAVDPTTFSGEDTNSTAMAAIALHNTGATAAADGAITRLGAVRTSEGGFAYLADPNGAQDGNSTGLVLLAYTTVNGSADAGSVSALGALQVPESGPAADRGGIAFQPQQGELYPDEMATIQALLGLADQGLPFTPQPPAPTTTVPTTVPASTIEPQPVPGPGAVPVPATPVVAQPVYTG